MTGEHLYEQKRHVDERGSIYRVLPTRLLSSIGLGWNCLVVERHQAPPCERASRRGPPVLHTPLTGWECARGGVLSPLALPSVFGHAALAALLPMTKSTYIRPKQAPAATSFKCPVTENGIASYQIMAVLPLHKDIRKKPVLPENLSNKPTSVSRAGIFFANLCYLLKAAVIDQARWTDYCA
jgi:hypothetical protein